MVFLSTKGGLMRTIRLWAILFISFGSIHPAVFAQDQLDKQVRLVFHPTVDLGQDKHWFIATWSITNVKSQSPNNSNLLAGIGYRGNKWWLEGMLQSHWGIEHKWWLDFRFSAELSERANLYVEAAPLLGEKVLYTFITFDHRVIKKLNFGFETENVNQAGQDSLSMGPRLSYPIVTKGKFKVVAALAYQFHRLEPNVLRGYVVVPLRF